MMVREGVLITPPITANLLEGIVRKSILAFSRNKLGLTVVERNIDRSELYMADEAVFCGTGVQMSVIGSIDHRAIGNPAHRPISNQIGQLFRNVLLGEEPEYLHWLSKVY